MDDPDLADIAQDCDGFFLRVELTSHYYSSSYVTVACGDGLDDSGDQTLDRVFGSSSVPPRMELAHFSVRSG
jgi:hypothetical protein